MLSIKRSLELERQWVIRDFKALLHQWEAEAAAAHERAKIVRSRKDLQARVKCAKAVMRAKYDYRVAVQEARAIQCNELKEAEATYSEALHKNAATQSLHCTALCGEHVKYMSELEEWALEAENRSQQDFLSAHLAILHHAPPSLKEDLHSSYNILLGNSSSPLQSHSICQGVPGTGVTTCNYFPQVRTYTVPMAKKVESLTRFTGRHVHR